MSLSSDRPIPLDVLRGAVAEAARRSSLRSVAADVGITHGGLRKFLDGSPPREATVRKLTLWYVRDAAAARNVSREAVAAALSLLLAGIPEEKRAAAEQKALAALRRIYADAGVPVPRELAGE